MGPGGSEGVDGVDQRVTDLAEDDVLGHQGVDQHREGRLLALRIARGVALGHPPRREAEVVVGG